MAKHGNRARPRIWWEKSLVGSIPTIRTRGHMWAQGQTLRHKTTNALVRLAKCEDNPSLWAWDRNSDGTHSAFDEAGRPIRIYHGDFTHVEDELSRPVFGKGQHPYPDLTLKRFINGDLATMRKERLEKWTDKLILEMKTLNNISCPFSDGSRSFVMEEHFLHEMHSKPLYTQWSSFNKRFVDGPPTFMLHNKQWLFNSFLNELVVIETLHARIVDDE
jgi:hypothetical protein